MSSLRNILNPDDGRRRTVKLLLTMPAEQHASTSELPSSPATSHVSDNSDSIVAEPESSGGKQMHEPHTDCPDNLACLPDTDGRPQHTLPVILRCAILGSPRKRLTIREIYAAMEAKYSYYKTAGPTWKQSVRHHLSLNRLFERQPRPVTDPGFGSYWTVNLTAPPGTKRPRKRGRPNKDIVDGLPAPAKKRGRPRKIISPVAPEEDPMVTSLHEDDNEEKDISTTLNPATYFNNEEDCDLGLGYEDDIDGPQGSEEDYESEEEMIHPLDRRPSLVGLSMFAPNKSTQAFSLPPFSSLQEGPDNIVDRMQAEIASLRRQSAEAVSLSLRLSEQLVNAQAEASRTRSTLRNIESILEGESKRRREAERNAENEERKRRKAEDVLNDFLSQSSNHNHPSHNYSHRPS
ncbi:hypothetical protein BDZ94DRAFT_1316917 [Collybia nuda]|uniref:Fork-head domain-containing protein n=1 Tax=Collybia nuda TaxID=64659 RepID=A0A9P6CKB7_9AGAR|nr:hypothetical protein BDZ94DRAFT_1316917 [Collybia nuda]